MEQEQKELEKIEYQKRTWKSKFAREQYIWDEIVLNINYYKGERQELWERVMDLYNEKYR